MRKRDENKIETICERAIEIIVKSGFDGLSMQKLAKAAKVSPATIYIYFKDREDLILQVALKEAEKMTAATLKEFSSTMNFAEGLRIQWKNRARYWLDNPLRSQFMEQIRHSPIGETVFKRVKKEFSKTMSGFVMGAIKRKELKKLPLEVYWCVAFAPLYQLIKFHFDGKGLGQEKFVWRDDYMNQALTIVLKALKP